MDAAIDRFLERFRAFGATPSAATYLPLFARLAPQLPALKAPAPRPGAGAPGPRDPRPSTTALLDAHSDVEGLPFALGGVDRLDLAGGLVWAARSYFDTLALATRRAEAGATLRSLPAAAREA